MDHQAIFHAAFAMGISQWRFATMANSLKILRRRLAQKAQISLHYLQLLCLSSLDSRKTILQSLLRQRVDAFAFGLCRHRKFFVQLG